ncbi:hypothetical protein PG996_010454 [Apiospora saccharicola]|uniref:CCHC-type domain-containing protein n=1 Tax=Apiospora saccharicola TaxID=335842 RepID=A0ABR1UNN8_9PEZI
MRAGYCYGDNLNRGKRCFVCNKSGHVCQGKAPLLLRRVARHLVEEALVLQKNLVEKQTKENDE